MELCKTRTKKSSPDLFNFYVVFAGHDKVNDAGRASTRAGANSKPHHYKQSTKTGGPFENMSFSKNPFEDFNEKKKQYKVLD